MDIAPKISVEFEKWVTEWVDLDNTVKAARAELRTLSARQKQLETMILGYMKHNDIEDIGIEDGSLEYRQSVRRTPLSKNDMVDLLERSGMLRQGIKAEETVDFLYENRRQKEATNIKRVQNRKKK